MATRLLEILVFGAINPGASAPLPHTLNINGTPIVPDLVLSDVGGISIVATTTTVTVTNNNSVAVTPTVWLERKHSIPRQLGGGIDNLTPQPFVVTGGNGASGGANVPVIAAGTVTAGAVFVNQKGFTGVVVGLPGDYTLSLSDPPADMTKLVIVATQRDATAGSVGEIEASPSGSPNISVQTFDSTGALAARAFNVVVYDLT